MGENIWRISETIYTIPAFLSIWATERKISGEYLAVCRGEYPGKYLGKYLRISIQFQPFLSIWASGRKISGEYLAVCGGEYLRISIQFQPFLSSLVRSSSSLCLFLVALEEAVWSCSQKSYSEHFEKILGTKLNKKSSS